MTESLEKNCNVCKLSKARSAFYRNKLAKDGFQNKCKACERAYMQTPAGKEIARRKQRKWEKANPEKLAAVHRRRTYQLLPDQYEARLKAQNNACAICGQTFSGRICVDHDHQTGAVRGLLCQGCNHALGSLKDSIEVLQKAIAYLQKFTA